MSNWWDFFFPAAQLLRFSAKNKWKDKMPLHAFFVCILALIASVGKKDFISQDCPKGGSMPLSVLSQVTYQSVCTEHRWRAYLPSKQPARWGADSPYCSCICISIKCLHRVYSNRWGKKTILNTPFESPMCWFSCRFCLCYLLMLQKTLSVFCIFFEDASESSTVTLLIHKTFNHIDFHI